MHLAPEQIFFIQNIIKLCELMCCAGIDLVHDQAEQALLSEVEMVKNCQNRLKNLHQRVVAVSYTHLHINVMDWFA